MGEIDERALVAHEEREFARRAKAIRDNVLPPSQGNRYQTTIATRFEWAHDYFERHDFAGVIDQADKILAASPTAEQQAEALRLRGRAERAARAFPDIPVKPSPVEPTWPF